MKIRMFTLVFSVILFIASCKPSETENRQSFTINNELTSAEKEGGVLTPEILWKFNRLSDHQLSPDGKSILYSLTRYNAEENKGKTDIFLIPSTGGEAVNLTPFDGSFHNPRWSPDGSKIGFLSKASGSMQLWEMLPEGEGMIQRTDFEGDIQGFEYSPDGEHIFYLMDVKTGTTTADLYPGLPDANVRIIDDLMYRHWNDWDDKKSRHIFITSYQEAMLQPGKDIMEDEPWDSPLSPYFDQSEISWGPDGKFLAYTSKKMIGKEYALSTNSDIYLYDLISGDTKNLTPGMQGYDKYPVFSNSGRYIAWQSMETPGYEADKNRLFIMDLETGEMRDLTPDFDQDAEHLIWSTDDQFIYFISGIEATYQIYRLEVANGDIIQLTRGDHDFTSFQLGNGFLTAGKMSISMATELFRINLENMEESKISNVNGHIYDHIEMGRVEERWVKTTDIKDMKVWVIYPPGFDPGKKYPALLYCQGGPQSAVSQFFSYRWNFQIMAAHDYIIVAPNRRGLPTFGAEWNEQISGDYGGQNIRDYLSAIDALSKEEFIDEDRLGAVGASYGGFSVFYLAGHHEGRFKAFISHCGIFNFESMYASTEEMFFANHDLEGAYWQQPVPKSYRFSPHRFVQNWDTPIMIITGEYDFRIPYTQSLEAFNAAQLNNVPSKLLVFPDETHFVVKPQNSILWQKEFFAWLNRYLK